MKDTEGEAVDQASLVWTSVQNQLLNLTKELTGAKTVVWNGPMGVFETQTSKLVQSVSWMLS